MSKQKKKGPGALILLAVGILLLCGALIFFLVKQGVIGGGKDPAKTTSDRENTATSASETEKAAEPVRILSQEELAKLPFEEAAVNAVKSFLALYQNCDPKAGEYISGMSEIEFPGIQAVIAKSMSFTVSESRTERSDDGTERAVLQAVIETVSFKDGYEEALQSLPEGAEAEKVLEAVSKKLEEIAGSKRTQFTLEIQVLDNVNSRKLLMTAELSDALTGGLMSYMAEQTAGGEKND